MTVSQIAFTLGIAATVAAVLSLQFKRMIYVISCQLITNALLCVQYLLEGGSSAGIISVIAVVQTVLCFAYSFVGKRFPLWFTAVFVCAYTAVTVINYKSFADVFCCAAVWFFAISIVQKHSYVSRACSFVNCSLWLIYDIIAAPSAILTHVVMVATIIISIIRLDRKDWLALFSKSKEKKDKIPKTS